jgi:hypothetical protein
MEPGCMSRYICCFFAINSAINLREWALNFDPVVQQYGRDKVYQRGVLIWRGGGISEVSYLRLGKDSDMTWQKRFIRLGKHEMDKAEGYFTILH